MAMTNAERQRNYRMRKMTGEVSIIFNAPPLTLAERSRRWREKHPKEAEQERVKARERRRRQRIEALTHYGNGKLACVKCGFNDIRALTLDHIDGREMNDKVARQRGKKVETSAHLCRRLKREGYPKGYQTLCMNCQWIKRYVNREYMKSEYR